MWPYSIQYSPNAINYISRIGLENGTVKHHVHGQFRAVRAAEESADRHTIPANATIHKSCKRISHIKPARATTNLRRISHITPASATTNRKRISHITADIAATNLKRIT